MYLVLKTDRLREKIEGREKWTVCVCPCSSLLRLMNLQRVYANQHIREIPQLFGLVLDVLIASPLLTNVSLQGISAIYSPLVALTKQKMIRPLGLIKSWI